MSKVKLTFGNGLAIMPSAANEKAVKNVLAKRLKLTPPESVQAISDATAQMHAKTKVPNAPVGGVQNMIDALHRVNPRLARVKAADLVDNFLWSGWKSPITSLNR